MKKIKYFLTIFVAVLLLTGCGKGNSTLTCTKTETDTGMDISEKHIMKFTNNKVTNLDLTINFKAVDEDVKTSWSTIVDLLDQQFTYENYDGIEFTKSNSEDTYTWALKVDLTKAKKENLATFDLESIADASDTYSQVKRDFEKDGYTCK